VVPPAAAATTAAAAPAGQAPAAAAIGTASFKMPEPPGPEALRGECVKAMGSAKYQQMLQSCTAAFAARPDAEVAARVAQEALERGKKADAVEWARKAIAANPTYADAYVFLGSAAQELGQRADARAAYRKYLELAPTGKYAADVQSLVRGL
jgi:Flp pilus assembly protein TadD